MKHKYTDEDVEFLKEYYPIGDWDKIYERFPDVSKEGIYRKCQKLGIKSLNTNREKFGSINRKRWSDNEISILKDNYGNIPLDDLQQLLPDRTDAMIKAKARTYQIPSFSEKNRQEKLWRDDDIQFIKNNWETTPDKVMAIELGHTFRAVKAKRESLGLYRVSFNHSSYPTLSKYLRGQNQLWKNESMKNCSYKCVLTGSKKFQIHHLYNVSSIINDIFLKYQSYDNKDFNDYNEDDLSFLTEKFLEFQNMYPLGECVDKNIHVLFHSLYGQYNNTPDQWNQFKKDFNNGLYKEYI